MKKSITSLLLALGLLSLAACNTVEGVGKDVKATGSAVENAAQDSKPR